MSEARDEVARLLEEGRTVAEIARVTGLATNTVQYHRDRVRAAMTDRPIAQTAPPIEVVSQVDTRERVADSLAEGLSRAETARRLGVSKATVSYHARRLGRDVDARFARRLGRDVDARFARRYDRGAVQRFYDEGHGVAECAAAFGFSKQTWHAAVNAGKVVPRPAATPIAALCVADTPRSRANLKRRLVTESRSGRRRGIAPPTSILSGRNGHVRLGAGVIRVMACQRTLKKAT